MSTNSNLKTITLSIDEVNEISYEDPKTGEIKFVPRKYKCLNLPKTKSPYTTLLTAKMKELVGADFTFHRHFEPYFNSQKKGKVICKCERKVIMPVVYKTADHQFGKSLDFVWEMNCKECCGVSTTSSKSIFISPCPSPCPSPSKSTQSSQSCLLSVGYVPISPESPSVGEESSLFLSSPLNSHQQSPNYLPIPPIEFKDQNLMSPCLLDLRDEIEPTEDPLNLPDIQISELMINTIPDNDPNPENYHQNSDSLVDPPFENLPFESSSSSEGTESLSDQKNQKLPDTHVMVSKDLLKDFMHALDVATESIEFVKEASEIKKHV